VHPLRQLFNSFRGYYWFWLKRCFVPYPPNLNSGLYPLIRVGQALGVPLVANHISRLFGVLSVRVIKRALARYLAQYLESERVIPNDEE
jgi:hypothetical protein